jgi:hypothetical protein
MRRSASRDRFLETLYGDGNDCRDIVAVKDYLNLVRAAVGKCGEEISHERVFCYIYVQPILVSGILLMTNRELCGGIIMNGTMNTCHGAESVGLKTCDLLRGFGKGSACFNYEGKITYH